MSTIEQVSLDQRWLEFQRLERLTNHWYWRPGWRPGRRFYTWHLTFSGQEALYDLNSTVQRAIDLPYVSLVPDAWLHLTMQGVGFTDEVAENDIAAIIGAARDRCLAISSFDMTLGPVDADAEGIGLLIRPWAPVIEIRDAVRDAIGTVWPDVPEESNGFRPHVTIAYSAADEPTEVLRDRLATLRGLPPVTIRISSVELIRLGRDEKLYEWDVVAALPLRN